MSDPAFPAEGGFGAQYCGASGARGSRALQQALERNRTRHKIVDEAEQEDGSVVIRIIKQYNRSPVGDYLD